jgi:hypothetical protein
VVGHPVTEERYDYMASHVDRYFRVLWEQHPKVFIAQVHGFCLAGGDLTVASEDAVFAYRPERYDGFFRRGPPAPRPADLRVHHRSRDVLSLSLFGDWLNACASSARRERPGAPW